MSSQTAPIRVLHVDDDSGLADLAATFVEREDPTLSVTHATNANHGWELLEAERFDCVVSDYEMPGRNGIEFLEAVRGTYPDLPFILFTGKGSEEVASDAISAGVTDYLQKEVGSSQYAVLANRIRNVVEKRRTEDRLSAREERLTLFFEESPLGVIEWDEEFDAVRLNEAAERILGYPEVDLVGQSWDTIVPETDRPDVEGVVDELLANEGGFHSVNENVTKNGDRIVCEWHNRVVTDEDGEVVTIFSQFQDITERRRQDRHLETLISNLPGIVYRCRNARGWPMEMLRGEVESLTGYQADDDRWDEGLYGTEIVHPDDRTDVWDAVQRAFEEGESFELTYRILTKDDEVKWVWERGRRLNPTDGDPTIEGFITDITDREMAHRKLETEQDFIEQALNALEDTFFVVAPDGHLLRWNERIPAVTGYSDAEIQQMQALDFFPQSERERVERIIEETFSTGYGSLETEILTSDGRHIPYEFIGSRLDHRDGALIGLVGVGRDISKRRARERTLDRVTAEYKTVFTEAQDAIFLFGVEQSGDGYQFRLQRLNPAHEAISGLSTEADRGKTPRELLGEATGGAVAANYRRCVETREPIAYEESLEMPAGEIHWETRLAPVIEDGDVVQIVGIAREVRADERQAPHRSRRRSSRDSPSEPPSSTGGH